MNAARAGRNVAGLAARRPVPSQAVSRQQVANKTTKGKGVVGGPKIGTVTPPLPPKPQVSQSTVTPPLNRRNVAHETVTPPKGAGGAAAGGGGPPPEKKSSNMMIGAVLVAAVAGSYYVTIDKMKGQDFLGDAEKEAAEEAQVNLHKSGLKVSSKVVPEQVEQAFNRASDAVSDAAKKVQDTAGTVAEKAGSVAAEVKSAVGSVSGAAAEVKEEVVEAVEEKPKKKGWRKYIIFGPRREG